MVEADEVGGIGVGGGEGLPADAQVRIGEASGDPDSAVVVGRDEGTGSPPTQRGVGFSEGDDFLEGAGRREAGQGEQSARAVAVEKMGPVGEVALGQDTGFPGVALAVHGERGEGQGAWILRVEGIPVVGFVKEGGVGEGRGGPGVLAFGKGLRPAVGEDFGNRVDPRSEVGQEVIARRIGEGGGFAQVEFAIVVVVQVGGPLAEGFLAGAFLGVVVAVEPELALDFGGSVEVAYGDGGLQLVAGQVGGQFGGVKTVVSGRERGREGGVGGLSGVVVGDRGQVEGGDGRYVVPCAEQAVRSGIGHDLVEPDGAHVNGVGGHSFVEDGDDGFVGEDDLVFLREIGQHFGRNQVVYDRQDEFGA